MRKNILFTFAILLMALCSSTKAWAEGDQRKAYAVVYDDGLLRFEYLSADEEAKRKVSSREETIPIISRYEIKESYTSQPEWCSENIKRAEFDSSFADYRPKSTAYWFYNCKNMESVDSIENLLTDFVTDMSFMFYHCSSLTSLDLSGLHTFNVTNMHFMFGNCGKLNYLDISDFNTSKVRDMSFMFCSVGLSSIDVSCFDTSQVEDMQLMFKGSTHLKELDLSGFDTKKVKNMNSMFRECTAIDSLYLGSFELTSLTNATFMFEYCSKLKTIVVSDKWRFNSSISSSAMFMLCTSLVGGQGTSFNSDRIDGSYAHIDGGPSDPGYLTEDTNGQFEDNSGQTRAYCVINNDVLTFYYDNKISSRQGLKFPVNKDDGRTGKPDWYNKRMLVNKAVIDPSFAAFRPTSTARWFYNCAFMTTVEGLSNLNTSEVTTMTEMFRFCDRLNNLDLSSFDTSNVTDMSFLVCFCTSLSNLDVSTFNTSKVVDMQHMFHMSPATELDLRSFDTKNVTDMNTMFTSTQLRTIYVSDKWSTESVAHSTYMFLGSTNLVGGMGTKYDSRHTHHEYACIDGGMCDPGYFTGDYQTGEPEAYVVLDDKGKLTFYYDFNKNCHEGSVFEIEEKYYYYSTNQKVPEWGGDAVKKAVFDSSFQNYYPTSTAYWFYRCSQMTKIEDIQYLNTNNVTDMSGMFWQCYIIEDIPTGEFDTSNVEDMTYMFDYCQKVKKFHIEGFNTEKVKSMKAMFSYCVGLEEIDLNCLETNSLEELCYLFDGCVNLRKIDIQSFNTSKVKVFIDMFGECEKLESIDVTGFDTRRATDMSHMFFKCKSLTTIDLSSFRTPNLKRMAGMFSYCISLNSIDLSTFNTSHVNDMEFLFSRCESVQTIYVSNNWSTESVDTVNGGSMLFYNCFNLVGGAGTPFTPNKPNAPNTTDYTYAHIDGGPDNPGYFTYKEFVIPTSIEELPSESISAQDETWYNLQGVKVDNPSKGIYIVNGKKVVRK